MHFAALSKGLEFAVVKKSRVPDDLRIDAQFFKQRYLADDSSLSRLELHSIGSFSFVTDGPHGYHEVDDGSPVAMLTAKCAGDWFSNRENADTIAKWVDDANRRSSLRVDDIILSTRGTVGNCALVIPESLPANIDQDVAKIAINPNAEFLPSYVVTYLNCAFGQDHIARHASGMVQQGLSLAKVREIPVPRLSDALQAAVSTLVQKALVLSRSSVVDQQNAQATLLAALGLAKWAPLEPLSYVASSRKAVEARRLDSDFFAPRIQELTKKLGRHGLKVGDVAPARHERFDPEISGTFDYIEIGGLSQDGTASSNQLDRADAPSRATWHVRAGDVITSTVRPIRRLSAMIEPHQDGFVASSGFVVLNPDLIASELLLTYLRLPVFCELMDLCASASMYPAISESDLLSLPFGKPDKATEVAIGDTVTQARVARQKATVLLECAKRAVEIGIEQGEAAAFRFLKEAGV